MLNNDKIRTMTRLAIYEENQGVQDDKINGYFKNDYIVGHMVGSFVSGTVAFMLIVMIYCIYNYDVVMEGLFEGALGSVIASGVTLYVAFMIFFLAVTFVVYHYRYSAARKRLNRYSRQLQHLKNSYEKEEKYGNKHI